MYSLHPKLFVLLSFLLSLIIVLISIPSIVNVAHLKHLYDLPGRRKSHNESVPNLGGIAIFASLIISIGLFANTSGLPWLIHLFVALIVLFFIGIKDDILVIAPLKKLYGEIIATIILVVFGNARFTNLHGFMGINELGFIPSIIITVFVVVVIVNSFNLIDGIDGLASGVGIIASLTFGTWFFLTGHYMYATVSAALLGSLISFFIFNVFSQKNKIFMGDTGSLIVGMIISVLVIRFNELNIDSAGFLSISASPAVSIGILIIPLFDTIRVFSLRIMRGKSPFHSDKNHLHHRMLKLGLSHLNTTLVLMAVNLVFILFSFLLQKLGTVYLMSVSLCVALLFSFLLEWAIRKKKYSEIQATE